MGVAVNPDGKKVYVTNYGSNTASVIDVTANTIITTVPAGNNPKAFEQFTGPVSANPVLPVSPGYANSPTSPDQDGLYEDINGNGIMDFDHVLPYYDNMYWIEENATLAFFDYNKNSLIDFDDIVKLYDLL